MTIIVKTRIHPNFCFFSVSGERTQTNSCYVPTFCEIEPMRSSFFVILKCLGLNLSKKLYIIISFPTRPFRFDHIISSFESEKRRFSEEKEEMPIHLIFHKLKKRDFDQEICRSEEVVSLKKSHILDFIRSLDLYGQFPMTTMNLKVTVVCNVFLLTPVKWHPNSIHWFEWTLSTRMKPTDSHLETFHNILFAPQFELNSSAVALQCYSLAIFSWSHILKCFSNFLYFTSL